MILLLVAIASVLGIDLIVRYVGRKHYVPAFAEMREDVSQWNHAFELEAVRRFTPMAVLNQNLARAGLYRLRLYHLLAAIVCSFVFGWAIGNYLFVGVVPSAAIAVLLAAIPIAAVIRTKNIRDERIYAQLDQVCAILITRCGGAGAQLTDALTAMIAETTTRQGRTFEPTLPPPLGPEMLHIYHDVYFTGMSFADACRVSAERVAHPKYTEFMTELAVTEQSTPRQTLTDFRIGLDSERQLGRFVAEQFAPYIAQAVMVPFIGAVVLLFSRLALPNGREVLAQPIGQLIFIVAWLLGLANLLFMRSQASLDAVLLGAEF